ncbi:hypothetical protein Goshw_007522, partial [Gossypium schwendimanii]|nr:hypothetical protein [Gossypium schwendimanii]
FPQKTPFFSSSKPFIAGVILSIGFIRVLSDASENLTSPCLSENPWDKFPLAKLLAMAAKIGRLMVDVFATSHYTKSHLHKTHESNYVDEEKIGKTKNHLHLHTHAIHGHAHDSVSMLERSDSAQLLRLQICIGMAHSMIIAISLGASESPKAIKPFVAALTFHQFFEGMGLGGCISQGRANAVMGLRFRAGFIGIRDKPWEIHQQVQCPRKPSVMVESIGG